MAVGVEFIVRLYHRLSRGYPFAAAYSVPSAKAIAYESHPYALYVKRPDAEGFYASNNLGYVGTQRLSREKPPGTVRIYCAGGSTTEQHDPAQGPDSSWPGQLQAMLAKLVPGAVECINAGVSGYTSAESLAEFLFRGIDLNPDVLLVYHNVNDAWTCQMVDGFRSDYSHARRHKAWSVGWINRLPQLPHLRTWQLIRHHVTQRFGRAQALMHWIADPPWRTASSVNPAAVQAFRRNIANLVAVAKANKCVPVLIKWECDWSTRQLPPFLTLSDASLRTFYEYLRLNNAGLQAVAQQEGCHYVDVGPFEPRHFRADGMHFSGEGLTAMASRVARAIEPIVAAVSTRSSIPVEMGRG
jgi:lysophospholipase L1-like esterase